MNTLLWGALPYVCITLFFVVPVLRMANRPFTWSTRASSLFAQRSLGIASHLMHWGLLLLLLAHLVGLFGGLVASAASIAFFYWAGLVGGMAALLGSILALARRIAVAEVRAMSAAEDYIVHALLIPILALGLYQVVVHQIFGLAYTASSWVGSLWRFHPQPELMASASLITKLHVLLAMIFFAYFPFTKLVHFWTFPVNFFVRPRQTVRTARYQFVRRWELALLSDKSWLVYGLGGFLILFLVAGALLGTPGTEKHTRDPSPEAERAGIGPEVTAPRANRELMGRALYVSQCARCHGLDGEGDGPGAGSPTFATRPRDFTAAKYRFVSTTNGVASNADLRRSIRRGLPSTGMPAFRALSKQQVDSLIRVLRDFADKPREPGKTIPVPPASEALSLEKGKKLYQNVCASCHGKKGRGNGPAAEGLTDWRGLPIDPRNLAAGDLKAGTSPKQLYWRIAAGIPGTPMPAYRGTFKPEQIRAIVKYLRDRIIPDQ